MKALLTRREFKQWLESLTPDTRPCQYPHVCPLNAYISNRDGISTEGVHVDGTGLISVGKRVSRPPRWRAEFVRRVDQNPWHQYTAADLLEILGEC